MQFKGGPANRKTRKKPKDLWFFISASEEEESRVKDCLTISLADAGLPIKIVNCLEDNSIYTIGDLCQKEAEELRSIQNMGDVSFKKCQQLLNDLKIPNKL